MKKNYIIIYLIVNFLVLSVITTIMLSDKLANFLISIPKIQTNTFYFPDRWSIYTSTDKNYSIEYPENFSYDDINNPQILLKNINKYLGFTIKGGNAYLIWFQEFNNPNNLDPVKFWAEVSPFWSNEADMNSEERNEEAKKYLENSQKITIGDSQGYKMTVSDTSDRTEIYWFEDKRVFNLGYNTNDNVYGVNRSDKDKIINHMLASFKIIKDNTGSK